MGFPADAVQDCRHGLQLAQRRSFTIVSILIPGLRNGATAAIFLSLPARF